MMDVTSYSLFLWYTLIHEKCRIIHNVRFVVSCLPNFLVHFFRHRTHTLNASKLGLTVNEISTKNGIISVHKLKRYFRINHICIGILAACLKNKLCTYQKLHIANILCNPNSDRSMISWVHFNNLDWASGFKLGKIEMINLLPEMEKLLHTITLTIFKFAIRDYVVHQLLVFLWNGKSCEREKNKMKNLVGEFDPFAFILLWKSGMQIVIQSIWEIASQFVQVKSNNSNIF